MLKWRMRSALFALVLGLALMPIVWQLVFLLDFGDALAAQLRAGAYLYADEDMDLLGDAQPSDARLAVEIGLARPCAALDSPAWLARQPPPARQVDFVWPIAASSIPQPQAATDALRIDVVLSQSNAGTLDFAVNSIMWLQRSAPQLVDRLQFFCEDRATYNRMYSLIGDHAILSSHVGVDAPGSQKLVFNTAAFLRLVSDRYEYIRTMLQRNLSVLFTDADVVALRDYEPYIRQALVFKRKRPYDLIAQADGERSGCMGFVFYRATKLTIQFVSKLINAEGHRGWNDQELGNAFLLDKQLRLSGFAYGFFNHRAFASGALVWGGVEQIRAKPDWLNVYQGGDTYMIHNNYAMGYASKLARFRALGMFLPELDFSISLAVASLSHELHSCLASLDHADYDSAHVHLRLLVTNASLAPAELRRRVTWRHGLVDIIVVPPSELPLTFASKHWRASLVPVEKTDASWGLFIRRPAQFEPCYFRALQAHLAQTSAARRSLMGLALLDDARVSPVPGAQLTSDESILAVLPIAATWARFQRAQAPSLVAWMASQRLSLMLVTTSAQKGDGVCASSVFGVCTLQPGA